MVTLVSSKILNDSSLWGYKVTIMFDEEDAQTYNTCCELLVDRFLFGQTDSLDFEVSKNKIVIFAESPFLDSGNPLQTFLAAIYQKTQDMAVKKFLSNALFHNISYAMLRN